MPDKKDLDIIQSIQQGRNSLVLKELYRSPLKKVRQYILSNNGQIEDANDLFQEAVIVLFTQARAPGFELKQSLEGFIFTIVKNRWIDQKRRKESQNTSLSDKQLEIDANEKAPLELLIDQEKTSHMQSIFRKLGDNCQKILNYSLVEKLKMDEIAKKMGLKNANVTKSTHYRCKQHLAKLIKSDHTLMQLFK